jgi:hypothetical protein
VRRLGWLLLPGAGCSPGLTRAALLLQRQVPSSAAAELPQLAAAVAQLHRGVAAALRLPLLLRAAARRHPAAAGPAAAAP